MDWKKIWRKHKPYPLEWQRGRNATVPDSPAPRSKITIHIVLFLLTLAATIFAGALQEGVNPLETPQQIYKGLPFSFALMVILLAHELGHYWVARRHGMNVTLPYFIPAPSFIGTFGAFIKMRSPARDRKVLLDVGAAGPLVGVAFAIPFLILGLKLSEVSVVQGQVGMRLGSSILLHITSWVIFGSLPEGTDIIIHPIGFAGWIGLLVTSLNLLPVGQLDGGQIAYALLGEKHNILSKIVFIGLLALGVFGWPGWLLWSLLLFLMGFRHPPPLEAWVPLDRRRTVIGWLTIVVFGLTFIPVPFSGF
jgi:membrane-associated protease RseP (regulator of RpoE activity)